MMLERVDQIDFNELYVLLLDASRKAFRFVQEAHPDETFYTFGFFYDASSKFIFPTCNSEEAHLRVGRLGDCDREKQTLKWFYNRWESNKLAYYKLGKKYFYPVSRWIDHNLRGDVPRHMQLLIWANIDDKILSTCLRVLKALDEEKFFGGGSARDRIVLTLTRSVAMLIPDPYIDEDECVRLLNPLPVYLRWWVEVEMCDHAHRFLDR
jgi:hypothetical protein